ncbi:hypothetical protein FKM82_006126 [Ascaphus truei]
MPASAKSLIFCLMADHCQKRKTSEEIAHRTYPTPGLHYLCHLRSIHVNPLRESPLCVLPAENRITGIWRAHRWIVTLSGPLPQPSPEKSANLGYFQS